MTSSPNMQMMTMKAYTSLYKNNKNNVKIIYPNPTSLPNTFKHTTLPQEQNVEFGHTFDHEFVKHPSEPYSWECNSTTRNNYWTH